MISKETSTVTMLGSDFLYVLGLGFTSNLIRTFIPLKFSSLLLDIQQTKSAQDSFVSQGGSLLISAIIMQFSSKRLSSLLLNIQQTNQANDYNKQESIHYNCEHLVPKQVLMVLRRGLYQSYSEHETIFKKICILSTWYLAGRLSVCI